MSKTEDRSRGKLVFLVALALVVSASAADDIECYDCSYTIGKNDTESCINPGASTPKRSCDQEMMCVTLFGYEYLSRHCWSNKVDNIASVERHVWNEKTYYKMATACNSSLCNDAPYTVPKYGQQVTCYKHVQDVSGLIPSLGELCAQEEGGQCETSTCQGFCLTWVLSYNDQTNIQLNCVPFCENSPTCCESDRCNSNLQVKKVDRQPINCYTCDDFGDPNCLQRCNEGVCSVKLSVDTSGAVSSERGCLGYYDSYPFYNASSKEELFIYKNDAGISKHLQKHCFGDSCNVNTDIPETLESLLEESKKTPSSASPGTSLQPSVTTTAELLLPGTSVVEKSCSLLLIVCAIASILLGRTHDMTIHGHSNSSQH